MDELTSPDIDTAQPTTLQRRVALADLTFGWMHEIKNALGVIDGRAYLAQNDSGEALSRHLELIRAEAKRATAMLTDIFDLAHPSPPAFAAVSLNAVATSMLELATAHLRMNEVAVVLKLSPSLPPVQGDSRQLLQVALNFMLNAVAALNGRTDGVMTVATETQREGVTMSLLDNGPGLATTSTGAKPFASKSGTGLGLFMASQIAAKHHGTIQVTNCVDGDHAVRGAKAELWLPLP